MPPAAFDPCKQWLGIDAVDLVDPRRVLGLGPGEADPLAVLRAAEARLARLRGVDPGPFAVARQALLKRVEEAREAVLQQIGAAGTGSAGPARPSLAMPPPPGGGMPRPAAPAPVMPPVPTLAPQPAAAAAWPDDDAGSSISSSGIEIRRKVVYRKKSSGSGLLIALILALAAAAGVLYAYKFHPDLLGVGKAATRSRVAPTPDPTPPPDPKTAAEPRPTPASQPVRKPKPRPAPLPYSEPESKPRPTPLPYSEPEPEPEPGPTPDPNPEPAPSETTGRLESLLQDLRERLQSGDFAAAQTAVEQAASVAVSKPSRERVARWAELVRCAKGFDGYRNKALAAVKVGAEYDIDGKKIAIVEIDDEKFIYRFAGTNRTTPQNRIPGRILMTIVTEWLDDRPANDLYLGAYHATKAEPDLAKARVAWQRAQDGGVDASLLLPLLEDPVLLKGE